MCEVVPLTQGKFARISEDDYDRVRKYNWCYSKRGNMEYAVSYSAPYFYMHQFIMDGREIDHADRNGLNNIRSNLRFATRSQNMANQIKKKGQSSKYKGVHWHERNKKWRAMICVDYKSRHLGLFDTEEEAAIAYNKAALEHFGEFARLNVVEVVEYV